jgi:hypothetical protein
MRIGLNIVRPPESHHMPTRIFISHSAADEALASALVDCILSSMVVDDADLRCTSVPGHKLPVGSDFAATLLGDIGDSSVVIGLITKNALSSSWVLFELGATWGAKKNLKPLVTDEVDLKNLPGPVSGRHVARLSNKGDLNQFLEEVAETVGAKRRSAAKGLKPMEQLLSAHAEHVKSATANPSKGRIETKSKEPTFAGVPFSELMTVLGNEKVTVPAKLAGSKDDAEMTLFEILSANAPTFSDGVQSNWDRDIAGGFLYREVALRLLPYGLVQFDKLPAAQAKYFKRLIISPEGHKFLLQYKRAVAERKT